MQLNFNSSTSNVLLSYISSIQTGERWVLENNQIVRKHKSKIPFLQRVCGSARLSNVLPKVNEIVNDVVKTEDPALLEDLKKLELSFRRVTQSYEAKHWWLYRYFFGFNVVSHFKNLCCQISLAQINFKRPRILESLEKFKFFQTNQSYPALLRSLVDWHPHDFSPLFKELRVIYRYSQHDHLDKHDNLFEVGEFLEIGKLFERWAKGLLNQFTRFLVDARALDQLPPAELSAFLCLFLVPGQLKLNSEQKEDRMKIEFFTSSVLSNWGHFFKNVDNFLLYCFKLDTTSPKVPAILLKGVCEDRISKKEVVDERLDLFRFLCTSDLEKVLRELLPLDPSEDWLNPILEDLYRWDSSNSRVCRGLGQALIRVVPQEQVRELYDRKPLLNRASMKDKKTYPHLEACIGGVLYSLFSPSVLNTFSDQEFRDLIETLFTYRKVHHKILAQNFISGLKEEKSKLEIVRGYIPSKSKISSSDFRTSVIGDIGFSAFTIVKLLSMAFQRPLDWEDCLQAIHEHLNLKTGALSILCRYIQAMEDDGVLLEHLLIGLAKQKFFANEVQKAFRDHLILTADGKSIGLFRKALNSSNLPLWRPAFFKGCLSRMTFNQMRLLREHLPEIFRRQSELEELVELDTLVYDQLTKKSVRMKCEDRHLLPECERVIRDAVHKLSFTTLSEWWLFMSEELQQFLVKAVSEEMAQKLRQICQERITLASLDTTFEVALFVQSLDPATMEKLCGWQQFPGQTVAALSETTPEGLLALFCTQEWQQADFARIVPKLNVEQWLAIYDLLTDEQKNWIHINSNAEQLLSCILFYRERWDEGRLDRVKITDLLVEKLFSKLSEIENLRKRFIYLDTFPQPIYELLLVTFYLHRFAKDSSLTLGYNQEDLKNLLEDLKEIPALRESLPATYSILSKLIEMGQWLEIDHSLAIFQRVLAKIAVLAHRNLRIENTFALKQSSFLTFLTNKLNALPHSHPYLKALQEMSNLCEEDFEDVRTYLSKVERLRYGQYQSNAEFLEVLESYYAAYPGTLDFFAHDFDTLKKLASEDPSRLILLKNKCLNSPEFQEKSQLLYQEIYQVYEEVKYAHLPSLESI